MQRWNWDWNNDDRNISSYNVNLSWNENLVSNSLSSPSVPISDILSTKHLIKLLDDRFIDVHYDEIIKSFNCHCKKDILYKLIKSATCQEIQKVNETLENIQSKHVEYDDEIVYENNNDNNNNSSFHYLPKESIYNICDFLSKSDMKSLKTVSISMALIIFDIMKCYKIGVFNMDELIQINEYKYEPNPNMTHKIKIKRIKPFTKYKSLMDIYCKSYNISFENILLLRASHTLQHNLERNQNINIIQLCKGTIINHFEFHNKVPPNHIFLVFNKNNISSLLNNDNNNYKSNDQNNSYLCLLQYFDIYLQRIQNVKFLSIHKASTSSRIHQFISRDLSIISAKSIPSDIKSSSLQPNVDYSNDSTDSINIYTATMSNDETITYSVGFKNESCSFRIIAFEKDTMYKPETNKAIQLKPFYSNIQQFVEDRAASYQISIENTDTNYMDHMYYFYPKWNDHQMIKDISINVTPLTTFKMIQNTICSRYDNNIPFENIVLFKKRGAYDYNIPSHDEQIGAHHTYFQLHWTMLPCSQSLHDHCGIHYVSIYQQTTQDFNADDQETKFWMKYKYNHETNNLIPHLTSNKDNDDKNDDDEEKWKPAQKDEIVTDLEKRLSLKPSKQEISALAIPVDDNINNVENDDKINRRIGDRVKLTKGRLGIIEFIHSMENGTYEYDVCIDRFINQEILPNDDDDVKCEEELDKLEENEYLVRRCPQCYGGFIAKQNPLNAYDTVGIICDGCLKSGDSFDSKDWYFQCKKCQQTDFCKQCMLKLLIVSSDEVLDLYRTVRVKLNFNGNEWIFDEIYNVETDNDDYIGVDTNTDTKTEYKENEENSPHKVNDNELVNAGTLRYEFSPYIWENMQNSKKFYYQNICSGNRIYSSKSFDELRFEDEYIHNAVKGINQEYTVNFGNRASMNQQTYYDESEKNMVDVLSGNNDMESKKNDGDWIDYAEMLSNDENIINLEDFMEKMIEAISHPMYGNKYKEIIDKYNDKKNYAFLIDKHKCIESSDAEITGFHYTNIVIVTRNNIANYWMFESKSHALKKRKSGFMTSESFITFNGAKVV